MNDTEQLAEIKLNMTFADSIETLKAAERAMKENKIEAKHKHHYAMAKKKLGLTAKDKFYKSHADKLTMIQCKVIHYTHIHTHLLLTVHHHIYTHTGRRFCRVSWLQIVREKGTGRQV